MTADEEFEDAVSRIRSAQHTAIQLAAGTWLALAGAAVEQSGTLESIVTGAVAEDGAGLLELADRLRSTRSFADGAASVARRIADQLLRAAQRSAQATERAEGLEDRIGEIRARQASRAATVPDGRGAIQADEAAEADKRRLADEARAELDRLGAAFAEVIGGDAPPAPGGRADSGQAPGAGAGAGGGAAADTGAAEGRGAVFTAPNGAVVGAGEYPYASVLGPQSGDFAGWVQSPTTGFLVDPATGREFDPVAGRWIDPVTGQPFGAVTEYATRLSGLTADPGAAAPAGGPAGDGALAGGVAAAGLAGLYGGVMPPSVGHAGPARRQLLRQAVANLGHRARVATGFAVREAAQIGGRPFTPPPAPGAGPRGAPVRQGGRVLPGPARPRGVFPVAGGVPSTGLRPIGPGPTAPPARGASPTPRAAGAPASPGVRGTKPPPAAGTSGGARRSAARPDGTRAPLTDSRRTWAARTPDAAARPGAAPPLPAASATQSRAPDDRESRPATTEPTENPCVWAPRREATRGVLGERTPGSGGEERSR